MLMKKNFPFILVTVIILLLLQALPAMAAQVQWQLIWRDNNTLGETVTINQKDFRVDDPSWRLVEKGDQMVYERNIDNWQAYQQLNDRLPLAAKTENYVLWRTTGFQASKLDSPAAGMYAQVSEMGDANIIMRVPGIIASSSGRQLNEDQVEFSLASLERQTDSKDILQVVNLDGLLIGLILFILGFLVIMVVFVTRIRKVNRLIAEEYSMERAQQIVEMEDKEAAEAAKDDENK